MISHMNRSIDIDPASASHLMVWCVIALLQLFANCQMSVRIGRFACVHVENLTAARMLHQPTYISFCSL